MENQQVGIEGKDYIVCPICGNQYRKITGGHLRTHGLNISSFREIYPEMTTECEDHIKIKSENEKKVMADPEFRKTRSENALKMWEDDKIRESRINGIRSHHSDPKFRAECAVRSSDVWKSDGFRDEMSRRMKEANKNPEVKRKRSDNMLKLWSDPKFAEKVFSGQKRFSKYICKSGKELTLKSSYEVTICKYLDELNIHFIYESKRFHYMDGGKHHSYYPDIYLPQYDLFLEVKPEVFQDNYLVQKKFNSVIFHGCNIIFVGEDCLESKEHLLKKIQTSTTIPRP